jgi:sulfite reductase beta subunit
MARQLPAGIMPDFRDHLPVLLQENYGRWVRHETLGPGVYRHLTADGTACLTVRILMPPNGFMSAQTLRLLAGWIRAYAQTGRRTSRQAFELVGVAPDRLENLLAEVRAHGFAVGGTGRSLHQVKGCNGYVHCQNGAIDSPSVMQRLSEAFAEAMTGGRYPARLKLAVSGCPNHCGAANEGDIGILGVFVDAPVVDDAQMVASRPDIGLLCRWCPAGAIRPKQVTGGRSVTISPSKCIRCSSCIQVAPEGIQMSQRRGAAILVGGRGPAGLADVQPRLGRIIWPFVPAEPVAYTELVAKVGAIIGLWAKGARPGERLGEWIDRVSWESFVDQVRRSSAVEP